MMLVVVLGSVHIGEHFSSLFSDHLENLLCFESTCAKNLRRPQIDAANITFKAMAATAAAITFWGMNLNFYSVSSFVAYSGARRSILEKFRLFFFLEIKIR